MQKSRRDGTASGLHWSPRNSKNKDVLSTERAGCWGIFIKLGRAGAKNATHQEMLTVKARGPLFSRAQPGSPSTRMPLRCDISQFCPELGPPNQSLRHWGLEERRCCALAAVKKPEGGGAWLAQSQERAPLDLRAVSSSPTLGANVA